MGNKTEGTGIDYLALYQNDNMGMPTEENRSVGLEYAHKLASTLMWKRFGDEKPDEYRDLAIKSPHCLPSYDYLVGATLVRREREFDPDDLWLYLSDLDVLRVKE